MGQSRWGVAAATPTAATHTVANSYQARRGAHSVQVSVTATTKTPRIIMIAPSSTSLDIALAYLAAGAWNDERIHERVLHAADEVSSCEVHHARRMRNFGTDESWRWRSVLGGNRG